MRELKIPLAIAAFLVVVLLGVGARYVYFQKRVVDPLANLTQEIAGVTALDVVPSADGHKNVVVTLGPDVQLEDVYREVYSEAVATLGDSFNRIVVHDHRSPELVDAYYRVHFTVQEGISTGRFSQMAVELDRRLDSPTGIRHRVFVGTHNVYIQLDRGDHYLYEVVPRPQQLAAGNGPEGGRSLW